MARTQINPADQIPSASLTRAMHNTATAGAASIVKAIAGVGVSLTSTGADAGTGDVTLNSLDVAGGGALSFNGLGDSITESANSFGLISSTAYQGQLTSNIPQWVINHAYTLNQLAKNNSLVYVCTVAGTSSGVATGPTGTATSGIVDNTAQWGYVSGCNGQKTGSSQLFWAEVFSQHNLFFDQESGYGGVQFGVLKAIVLAGGTAYAGGDTVTLNFGASATLTIASGIITGCTITNPGNSGGQAFTATLNTSTGSGAYICFVQGGTGTFGVNGGTTKDCVAMLPDVVASTVQVIAVNIGVNDFGLYTAAQTMANLTTIYNTLMAAGKRVIAIPILPRATLMTGFQRGAFSLRINNFIRAFVRRRTVSGASMSYSQIVLADPTQYMVDGTNGTFWPIGGTGGTTGSVMKDGLHPSNRGAQYMGYTIAQAAQAWLPAPQTYIPRGSSADDGYDISLNPGGNIYEGPPWVLSTAYILQQQVSNGGNVYRCITAGTSASSGGPTTTSTNITDGTAHWAYMWPAKMSMMASGAAGVITAAAGVTITGNVPTGMSLARGAGTAAGTLTASIENPWSNGQIGQRLKLVFSLGSGTALERWDFTMLPSLAYASFNIIAGELGVTKFQSEIEFEISASTNLTRLELSGPADGTIQVLTGPALSGAGNEMIQTSGDPLTLPNGGRWLFKSPIVTLPTNITNCAVQSFIGFNASGGAGSATLTLYINYVGLRRIDKY